MDIYSDYIINNKYSKWYFDIIDQGKKRILEDKTYTEVHHIIPKSFGGTDEISNLVILTYREHFLCHWLLTKCVSDKYKRKALGALSSMRRNKKQVVSKSSWRFEVMKQAVKEAMTGRTIKEETKEKNRNIAIALHNDPDYIEKWKRGMETKPKAAMTDKRKEAARRSILKYNGSEKHILDVKRAQIGRIRTEEEKLKQSNTMKNGAAAFGERNSMKNPDHVDKVRKSKIGLKSLVKEGQPRKLAKPGTEKWNMLISNGYRPASDMIG
jgi:hypothetical protein